mmetsp:Transcript_3850/g.12284  ORF Transcript_3850/g.12284 Transcript_3850/m.12284 type:complete len:258 (-) Transcript_3850:688-1461(-)
MKLEGESGTFVSKVAHAPRWHLYVAATQASFLTSNFPRKLLLNIDNTVVPVNYAVRACKALQMPPAMQSYHKLMVHGSLKGCKGWRPEVANNLLPAHRLCICDAEAAKRKERKEAWQTNGPASEDGTRGTRKRPPLKAVRLNMQLAKLGPNEKLATDIARTHKELAEARSRIPLKDLSLHRQLRQEDLHSKEFFARLKTRKWKANITELFRTKNWDQPEHSERETAISDYDIRREFRRYYYVWPLSRARGEKPQGGK